MEDSSVALNRRIEALDYSHAGLTVVISGEVSSTCTLTAPLARALIDYVEHDKPITMPMPDALWLAALASSAGAFISPDDDTGYGRLPR